MKVLIIGGNRFFGKKLARRLLEDGHSVTLLNRGNLDDGLGSAVKRIRCDRKKMASQLSGLNFDVVYDQACFEAREAKAAIEVFRDKCAHYIFTSTQSVYDLGPSLKEEQYNPYFIFFESEVTSEQNYGEAKRQAEAAFFQQKELPVTAVRFPLVIGKDDYTGRFAFHVDHVRQGRAMSFPDPEARHAFINSDDAASALYFFLDKKFVGPVNACSPEPLSMRSFLEMMGTPVFSSKGDPSPFGIEGDWFMNPEKLASLGLSFRPIREWLPSLLS